VFNTPLPSNGCTCKNTPKYEQIILGQSFSELQDKERLYGWFQQDSATAHTARTSMQALPDVTEARSISSGIRPARSPYLNPSGFLFWGCLKDDVYNSNPRKEEELEENILREIANIPAEPLPPVRGMSTFRGTAFSTPPVICKL
jgi:hypothetical protein